MIIVADSGASKTSWRILNEGHQTISLETQGLHPLFVTSVQIGNVITKSILPWVYSENVNFLFFYGAGCAQFEYAASVMKPLKRIFKKAKISVESDLLGTARALCGTTQGMVAIIGTGSNACQYDGKTITRTIVSLGYILGDEGSGAVLGKRLLKGYLSGVMPTELSTLFLQQYGLNLNKTLQHLYINSHPNRFLASLSPFAFTHRNHIWIRELLKQHFNEFICHIITSFPDYDKQILHLSGSVAHYFSKEIKQAALKYKIEIGKIVQYPIDQLVEFHVNSG